MLEFEEIKEKYSLDQIYNGDESGLNYKCLPTSTLTTPNENKPSNTKLPKDRITFMTCSNASGSHSLPIAFIHKVKNPRSFQTGGIDSNKRKTKIYKRAASLLQLLFH